MSANHGDRELRLAELLVAYESQLAIGDESTLRLDTAPMDASDEERALIECAQRGLLLLERLWPHEQPRMPQQIGRFRIERELGHGGFGIVYLAYDQQLDRRVALKLQRPETLLSQSLRARFVRESKAAARLEHPHIAGVYDVGEAGPRVWIASEYVAGGSLASWLAGQNLSVAPQDAARFVAELAQAVSAAHEQGVLHRDLKPSNVLLHRTAPLYGDAHDLGNFEPKLIDFGLARLDEVARGETRTGALIGTPPYMSPEQASGNVQAIGPETDVYGLGTILYELLTGRRVFQGETDVATLLQVTNVEPVLPRRLRPQIPADLEAIVLKCLEKEPKKRYGTARELAEDLQRFRSHQPTVARPLKQWQRLAKWVRRHPTAAGLIAVSMLGLFVILLGTGAYTVALRRSAKTAEDARRAAEVSADQARSQEVIANQNLYAARMREAYEAATHGEPDNVRRLLAQYEPPSPWSHLRGFEWYHLRRRNQSERLSLVGHRGEVYALAYSPDGNVVASGGQDGTIRLWDRASGKSLKVLEGHESCVNGVAFTPQEDMLVSVSCDRTIKLWDTRSWEISATLDRRPAEVLCLAISPDGTRLATGGRGPLISVWDLATTEVLRTLTSSAEHVDYLAWRDAQTLLAPGRGRPGGNSGELIVWNVDTDERVIVPKLGRSLAVSPDGRDVVLGTDAGDVQSIADLSSNVGQSRGRGMSPRALAFFPRKKWLAAGYEDSVLEVMNWPPSGFRQVLLGHRGRVQAAAVAPAEDELATASFDGTVKLWDLRFESLPAITASLCMPASVLPGHVVAMSDDLRYLAVPTSPTHVQIFDVDRGEPVAQLSVPDQVWALAFSSGDASSLYGCSIESRSVWRWDWREDKLQTIARLPAHYISDAAFSPDGRQLLMMGEERTAIVFDTRLGESWTRIPYKTAALGRAVAADLKSWWFSPFAGEANNTDSASVLLDLNDRRSQPTPDAGVEAFCDRWIAVTGTNHNLSIRDRTSGAEASRISMHPGTKHKTFSRDGRTLAMTAIDRGVTQWNVATGQLISQFEFAPGEPISLQYSANGRRLAVCTRNILAEDEKTVRCSISLYVWRGTSEP